MRRPQLPEIKADTLQFMKAQTRPTAAVNYNKFHDSINASEIRNLQVFIEKTRECFKVIWLSFSYYLISLNFPLKFRNKINFRIFSKLKYLFVCGSLFQESTVNDQGPDQIVQLVGWSSGYSKVLGSIPGQDTNKSTNECINK